MTDEPASTGSLPAARDLSLSGLIGNRLIEESVTIEDFPRAVLIRFIVEGGASFTKWVIASPHGSGRQRRGDMRPATTRYDEHCRRFSFQTWLWSLRDETSLVQQALSRLAGLCRPLSLMSLDDKLAAYHRAIAADARAARHLRALLTRRWRIRTRAPGRLVTSYRHLTRGPNTCRSIPPNPPAGLSRV